MGANDSRSSARNRILPRPTITASRCVASENVPAAIDPASRLVYGGGTLVRWRRHLSKGRLSTIILAVTTGVATIFLFANLGHYSLWDDEADTALIGQGVWRTGDTSAVLKHNIVGYRGGAELQNLKERYHAPLQYYLVAPFSGLFPTDPFAVRLPFAVVGLLATLLICEFCRRRLPWPAAAVVSIGLIGNVSFWLYCRQCRYYSVSISSPSPFFGYICG